MKFGIILPVLFFLAGCTEHQNEVVNTVPIKAAVRSITLNGYDGFITFDWDIMNTSNNDVDGWEIKVHLESTDGLHYYGIFFDHDAMVVAGDTVRFYNNILFYVDESSVYPIRLKSASLGIQRYDIYYANGIIRE